MCKMVCFQAVAAIYQEQQTVPAHVMMKLERTAHVVVPMVTVEEQVANVMTALVAGIGLQVTGCVTVSSFHIFERRFDLQNELLSGCGCNTIGTSGSSSTCTDQDGLCNCASSLGYTGDKCDMCLDGWLLQSDSTCRSMVVCLI